MLAIAILDIFYICMRKRTHQATTGGSLELGLLPSLQAIVRE